eukprot:CAMPEP_0202957314 /NCGR_PEP_ID=MMETSP1396-20130829/1748_1 /ASSEMBLY_ACC=CAM_ASM_000872 /TAXON_ID= /ORGANISM="Pseudokeronopsis sp., Strain Brazil" /LENGTH=89 /DNA_ID=CAMNT_0049674749 /DNA_START=253 /DNA_END=522 /DNA_ORIENTATION=-
MNPEEDELTVMKEREISHVPQTAASRSSRTSMPAVKRNMNGELTQENVKKMEEANGDKNILNKLKSYRTNSTVAVLQGMSLKQPLRKSL